MYIVQLLFVTCSIVVFMHSTIYIVACSNFTYFCRVQKLLRGKLILHSTNVCSMQIIWHSTTVVLCHQFINIDIHLYYAQFYENIYPLLYKNRFINDISFQNVHFSTLEACESPSAPLFSLSFVRNWDFKESHHVSRMSSTRNYIFVLCRIQCYISKRNAIVLWW